MNENDRALDTLVRVIKDYVTSRLKKAAFDRTLFGTVTAVLDDGYQVNIAGQNHKVKSKDMSIPVRTVVRVKLPCNSWTNAYIESIV